MEYKVDDALFQRNIFNSASGYALALKKCLTESPFKIEVELYLFWATCRSFALLKEAEIKDMGTANPSVPLGILLLLEDEMNQLDEVYEKYPSNLSFEENAKSIREALNEKKGNLEVTCNANSYIPTKFVDYEIEKGKKRMDEEKVNTWKPYRPIMFPQ